MKLGLAMYLGWHPVIAHWSLQHFTNHQYDLINSAVEFGCWFPCLLSCLAMYKEKDVRGNSVVGQLYYTICAFWWPFYFHGIEQSYSYLIILGWSCLYAVETALMLHYKFFYKRAIASHSAGAEEGKK